MNTSSRAAFGILWWLSVTDAMDRIRRAPFLALAALCLVLTATSVWLGELDLEERRAEARTLIDGRQESAGSGSARQMQPAFREVRQPEALSVLVRGLDASIPLAWDFSPSGAYPTAFAAQPASRARAMSLDIEFVTRILLSLVAVLTATIGLRAQRGSDLLRDLRSLSIPPAAVVGSQILGGLIAVGIASSAVSIGAFVGALASPEIWSASFVIAVFELFFASWAYCLVFYLIGLGVLLASRQFHSALTTSVIAWAVVALTLPPLADLLIQSGSSVATASAVADRQQRFDASIRQTEKELGDVVASLTHGGQDKDLVLKDPLVRQRLEEVWAKSVANRRSELHSVIGQLAWAAESRRLWLGFISPATSLSSAMTRLAGTGPPLSTRWTSAIRNREIELNRLFFDDPARLSIRIPASLGGEFLSYSRHPPALPSSFERQPVAGETILDRLWSAVAPLLQLWCVAAVLAAFLLRRFT